MCRWIRRNELRNDGTRYTISIAFCVATVTIHAVIASTFVGLGAGLSVGLLVVAYTVAAEVGTDTMVIITASRKTRCIAGTHIWGAVLCTHRCTRSNAVTVEIRLVYTSSTGFEVTLGRRVPQTTGTATIAPTVLLACGYRILLALIIRVDTVGYWSTRAPTIAGVANTAVVIGILGCTYEGTSPFGSSQST